MPKRTDIASILILGAGPIVIGQACEFDYSGVQACRALKQEGYRIILVNSNPATIMTDPSVADATYIEPIQWPVLAKIIEREKPCALLPTMGGQTALNCALDLAKHGVLDAHGVELIGAKKEAIDKAEDREKFRLAMQSIGLASPHAAIAHSLEEATQVQARLGFPTIIRPSFTLGGTGGGIAYNREEFVEICQRGLELSPTSELLIEESLLGWKEYEMEVVRDSHDNCIIVCSIENLDPMGVHTGDSITIAPAQTLTDKEYQVMRDASLAILREVGVETGGSNVQFAVNPIDGRMVVIEMNPRVSRSSALASKATGFPIAKVAARLAVGYTLDELDNEITRGRSPAAFEPTIDYIVTKIPRFNFEKFPQTSPHLTTQMKSVGEVMAIGRTFQESLQKALRGLEIGVSGFNPYLASNLTAAEREDAIRSHLKTPGPDRLWVVGDAFRAGYTVEYVHHWSAIDPWFLSQIHCIIQSELAIAKEGVAGLNAQRLRSLKRQGFSDKRIGCLVGSSEANIRQMRHKQDIAPVFKRVDTCAAEFPSETAYLYSTYEQTCEANVSDSQKKVIVLGGGPNRIGQGIEFDYCCVHAVQAMREAGFEAIMINCNPETVSTDYDVSDRLYFEPLTLEDVLAIVAIEQPYGVVIQYGGQTPLKLARALEDAGVPILGTSPDAIDRAENRERFYDMLGRLHLQHPANRLASTIDEGKTLAEQLGYPLIVRPSYVLGGRAMEIVYNSDELDAYLKHAVKVSEDAPVLLDRFLDDAIEVDVDAISDGETVIVAGIMEHIEQAGVHSGDSSCAIPPHSLKQETQNKLADYMRRIALELQVVGLINAQFAIKDDNIYMLEVNPRASRTIPFVSKAIGVPVAKIAARCMLGQSLTEQAVHALPQPNCTAVKVSVFPFNKFLGVDPILGPEMKSTGEVMGFGVSFAEAFAKAQMAAGIHYHLGGKIFISVRDADKPRAIELAASFIELGFEVVATRGTAGALQQAGVPCTQIHKVLEGRPHIVDMIKNREINFIVNTTQGKQAISDSYHIRRNALQNKVNYTTTLAGASAALLAFQQDDLTMVKSLQERHRSVT